MSILREISLDLLPSHIHTIVICKFGVRREFNIRGVLYMKRLLYTQTGTNLQPRDLMSPIAFLSRISMRKIDEFNTIFQTLNFDEEVSAMRNGSKESSKEKLKQRKVRKKSQRGSNSHHCGEHLINLRTSDLVSALSIDRVVDRLLLEHGCRRSLRHKYNTRVHFLLSFYSSANACQQFELTRRRMIWQICRHVLGCSAVSMRFGRICRLRRSEEETNKDEAGWKSMRSVRIGLGWRFEACWIRTVRRWRGNELTRLEVRG